MILWCICGVEKSIIFSNYSCAPVKNAHSDSPSLDDDGGGWRSGGSPIYTICCILDTQTFNDVHLNRWLCHFHSDILRCHRCLQFHRPLMVFGIQKIYSNIRFAASNGDFVHIWFSGPSRFSALFWGGKKLERLDHIFAYLENLDKLGGIREFKEFRKILRNQKTQWIQRIQRTQRIQKHRKANQKK